MVLTFAERYGIPSGSCIVNLPPIGVQVSQRQKDVDILRSRSVGSLGYRVDEVGCRMSVDLGLLFKFDFEIDRRSLSKRLQFKVFPAFSRR
jgi:hypothetical protein